MPKISVIVPVYNTLDCVEKCVHSILNQTYSNLELLLVDDGSTDGCDALLDQIADQDTTGRVRVFHKENGGSSSARNYGIERARGDYLGFVDSDDYIDEHMYETLMKLVEETGCAIAQVSRDEVDVDGQKRPDVCIPPSAVRRCDSVTFLRELLMHTGDASYCTKLVKRELFENHTAGFPIGVLNEDFYLLIHMLEKADGVVISPHQYYHVYYREGSNTRRKDKNDFSRVYRDIVDNADVVETEIVPNHTELKTVAKRFALYQRLDYMLHIPVAMMTRDNDFYQSVKKYLRKNIFATIANPYLSVKNKIYLLLLTAAPYTVRAVHAKKMERRDSQGGDIKS